MDKYKANGPCRKCGSKEIVDTWHKDVWECRGLWTGFKKSFEDKHIHRRCKNCGFEWAEMPLDGEK